jgi:tRNA threonylcarbamoyladenosine biosynthesis protein TsaE
MTIVVNDIKELQKVAETLIRTFPDERVFLFYGHMGAGKTTFINMLCQTLGVKDNPSSPTFSIVNEYASENGPLYHFDFYRLKSETEAFDLGYEEYFYSDNYCFVEWPEKIANLLPIQHLKITLETTENQSRIFTVEKK